jgi:DNA (cytosine-5)-methyltransferase 1
MTTPRALDLFCGAGGASMGLHRAGFDVTGIDIKPQKRYPFRFIQADALRPPVRLEDFDLIWASPPCQRWTDGAPARMARGRDYPDLIDATRRMLKGHRSVIENVMKAPVRPDLVLHGHMFGLKVIRRRKFEFSWSAFQLVPPLPRGLLRDGYYCVTGHGTPKGIREMGLHDYTSDQVKATMGIDWMSVRCDELAQAIPPAYAEFIGREALQHMFAGE